MASDKLILHRFMCRQEYYKYLSGEVLHNESDHYRDGKGGSTSRGFCFFKGNVREWAHRLNGLVSFDVLLTVEIDVLNFDGDIRISSGVYAEDPSEEYVKRRLLREICTTAYSMATMRFVSADFKYSMNPNFVSKGDLMEMVKNLVK